MIYYRFVEFLRSFRNLAEITSCKGALPHIRFGAYITQRAFQKNHIKIATLEKSAAGFFNKFLIFLKNQFFFQKFLNFSSNKRYLEIHLILTHFSITMIYFKVCDFKSKLCQVENFCNFMQIIESCEISTIRSI